MDKDDATHWTKIADEWISWAKTPNHDAFWAYREAFLSFVGKKKDTETGNTLEVGCGEGRISRELKTLGYKVTATDAVAAMVDAAKAANSADAYAVAKGDALPFPDKSFDLVVAYNVLMDVKNVPATIKDMRRVLVPNGTMIISIVHPFRDRGRFVQNDHGSSFIVDSSYFGREYFEDSEERDGLQMHFAGWSQPLENYVAALESANLAITSLKEPIPAKAFQEKLINWTRMPMFLWLKARIISD